MLISPGSALHENFSVRQAMSTNKIALSQGILVARAMHQD